MLFSCEKKKSAETIKYPVITQKNINAKKNTFKENEYSESKKIPKQEIGNYTRTYKNADLKKIASSVSSIQRLFEFNQKWLSNGYPYCIMDIDNQNEIIQDALNSNLTIDDLINWSDLVARCGNTEASISFLEKLLELCETESQENQIKSLLAIAYLITSDPSQSEDHITIKQDTVKNLNYAVELGSYVANATQNPKNSKTIILGGKIRDTIRLVYNAQEDAENEMKWAQNQLEYYKKYNIDAVSYGSFIFLRAMVNAKNFQKALEFSETLTIAEEKDRLKQAIMNAKYGEKGFDIPYMREWVGSWGY